MNRDLAAAVGGTALGGVLLTVLVVAKLREDVARLRARLALARAGELECWLGHQNGRHVPQIAQLAQVVADERPSAAWATGERAEVTS